MTEACQQSFVTLKQNTQFSKQFIPDTYASNKRIGIKVLSQKQKEQKKSSPTLAKSCGSPLKITVWHYLASSRNENLETFL